MSKYPAATGRRPYEIPLLVVAVAAAGLNLRTAITSLPPLFPDLQDQLHLSSATLSLLAATPVICFGVVSAFAAWLNRRYGEERDPAGRAGPDHRRACCCAARRPRSCCSPAPCWRRARSPILNVLLSSMVKRRWPERAGLLIGIYLTTLSLGAIVSSLLSVPLYRSSGRIGAAHARRVGGPRRAGRAALAAPAQVPPARPGAPRRRSTADRRRHGAPRLAASRSTGTRSPGRSPRSWGCRACCTTRRCPGCRPSSRTAAPRPSRPATCSR